MAFTLPKLPYAYDALEPFINRQTMEIHHTKHHQAYVDNLNKTLAGYAELSSKSVEELLTSEDLPEEIWQAVINHGGGYYNHSFFWKIMCPASDSGQPEGKLLEAINSTFGSFAAFKEQFTAKALGVFGSGWAFLLLTPEGKLSLKRHSFQNTPIMHGNTPILGVDVWEHAYYLQYKWQRVEYVKNWWNIVNWSQATKNFEKV